MLPPPRPRVLQAIAYALLAELPPTYGLYSSLLPLAVFVPFTSSRHVALGPFALISMLVADSVSQIVDPSHTEEYCRAAVLLSAMVGGVHLLMAAVRAGA
jgi:sulfate transporter 4